MRLHDLRQAGRSLWRTPWYALTVGSVIALSLALSTTVFAIVDGALFKPLPYPETNRLFAVSTGWSKLPEPLRRFGVISAAEFQEFAAALPDSQMTAFYALDSQTVGVHDSVAGARVDARFSTSSECGRLSAASRRVTSSQLSRSRPGLITRGFWQRRFGRDPSAVGRSLTDDTGKGIRVVGILPDGFVFPFPASAKFVLCRLSNVWEGANCLLSPDIRPS